MTKNESRYFATLAELEFAAGAATVADGSARLSKLSLQLAQGFDTCSAGLRAMLEQEGGILMQTALPVRLVNLDKVHCAKADVAQAAVAEAAGMRLEDLVVALVDTRTGLPLWSPTARARPLAVCINRRDLGGRRSEAGILGRGENLLSCRFINTLSALKTLLRKGEVDRPILHIDIQPNACQAALLTSDDILPLAWLDVGTQSMLDEVMTALGLIFKASAARLFHGDVYDFQNHAWRLVSTLVKGLSERIAQAALNTGGCLLHLSGAPLPRKALLERPLADRLGMRPLPFTPPIEAGGCFVPEYFAGGNLGLWHLLNADLASEDPLVADLALLPPDWAGIVQHSREMAAGPPRSYRGLQYGGSVPVEAAPPRKAPEKAAGRSGEPAAAVKVAVKRSYRGLDY